MQCIECKNHASFTCKCKNCGICSSCIPQHLSTSKTRHQITEISVLNSLFKCDQCTTKFASLRCLCQDEKKKFCDDCIRIHLDQAFSHCVESIQGSIFSRESLKNLEKRRKLECLSYDIRKSIEELKSFKEKVSSSKQKMLEFLDKSKKDSLKKSELCREKLLTALNGFSYVDSEDHDELADSILNQVNAEDLGKRDRKFGIVEASINSEPFLNALKNNCKITFLGQQPL